MKQTQKKKKGFNCISLSQLKYTEEISLGVVVTKGIRDSLRWQCGEKKEKEERDEMHIFSFVVLSCFILYITFLVNITLTLTYNF